MTRPLVRRRHAQARTEAAALTPGLRSDPGRFPRPAFSVWHRTEDGAVLVGAVVYAPTALAALDRAEASADARPGTWERRAGDAVLAWLA